MIVVYFDCIILGCWLVPGCRVAYWAGDGPGLVLVTGLVPGSQWASRPRKLKINNRSSRFKNIPHMWMKQSWVRWDNSQPILFSPICCNWRLSQVKIISWQYLKLLLWQKIRFYNGIWLFKMYRRFQWNTNESKSISPCQICLMECQFSIATRRWTELLGPEVPVPPTVHCWLSTVCHTFSQSQMKVKVTGISCINQLCKSAV